MSRKWSPHHFDEVADIKEVVAAPLRRGRRYQGSGRCTTSKRSPISRKWSRHHFDEVADIKEVVVAPLQ
jgi:hypothetical protein